jgi:hypothetical protein
LEIIPEGYKRCTMCKQILPLTEFSKNNKAKDGLCYYCRECNNKCKKEWYNNNPDKVKEYSKKYRYDNIDKVREKMKKYSLEYPDKCEESRKKWRKNNIDKERENNREWKKNNPEKYKESHRKWAKNHPERFKELNNKNKAKRKRNLGYIEINKYFKGSEGHHIDNEIVIYIPKELHLSIWHSVIKNKYMDIINNLVFEWLEQNVNFYNNI